MNNKILVGIHDEHILLRDGLSNLLTTSNDVEVVFKVSDRESLLKSLKNYLLHILIINVYALKPTMLNLLLQINNQFPKVKILALSSFEEEEVILRTIKCGAKGFLARDTEQVQLIEAIYTLRNGFDYYSQSITHILVSKYLKNLDSNNNLYDSPKLSTREIEILRLWGNSYNNKEIADILCISMRTVESHKNHIMQKLNLKTTVDLVKFAIKNNIIEV
jgi:DNA-binding NarL/FixJ family response regulator